ncbi:HAD-IA family hydrolase [Polynucleobacter sp. 73C-SIWE]|uniref:HAD-IA family hydrolase n=1 Tax=Polynucleobacter sp. 73C-SIWE TaxID=2689098 RepID=UPI001C0D0C91|nr:HAD-IA family hydrolase [Polynucleobacter sp. 73C-SIWE]
MHELNLIWHRLNPWSGTVAGLTRLKGQFTNLTLSNANLGKLTDMAKSAGLPWYLILSAEVFPYNKATPEAYLDVADIWDVRPEQVVLVAAKCWRLQTAFIERPLEFDPIFSRQDLH